MFDNKEVIKNSTIFTSKEQKENYSEFKKKQSIGSMEVAKTCLINAMLSSMWAASSRLV
jgi:hypothetical protein